MHVLATAGHVDHGKSTLLRALTGMEPDRLAEERRRGLSIDLGFVWTDIDGDQVAFVDVPGHERFVTTMLAGVGPVPAVLFVVAADGGWMPQSAEHLAALDALDVRHGVLAVTRSDLADPGPARERALAEIAATSLGRVPCVEVAAPSGQGIAALRRALATLVSRLPAPDDSAPVRLWVDRSFSVSGAGTVVTGTLAAGVIRTGDALVLEPDSRPVRVRALQCAGRPQNEVRGTSRVAVNLRGVAARDLRRGAALVAPGAWTATAEIDVRLHAEPDAGLPGQAVLHVGSAAVAARLRPLGGGVLRLRLGRVLPWHVGDRGLLREPGTRTLVGAVTALDVRPPALTRRGAAADHARRLAATAALPGATDEIRRRTFVRERDLVAAGLRPPGRPVAGGWYADPAAVTRLAGDLRAAVADWMTAKPLDGGLPADVARRRLHLPDAVLVDVIRQAAGLTAADGRILPPAADLPAALRAAVDAVLADLADAPFSAPDAERLAGLGLGSREIAAAVRAGSLLRVADGIVLAPGADRRAAATLARLPQPVTVSAARQALATTRRVAVPLLELLDSRRLTRRLPDDRREVLAPVE
ncbi:MAG TPA: selenocysteine-specific translation elongation factor [Mycobacteriales bacterium]